MPEDETKTETNTIDIADSAVADSILHYKNLYEEEKAKREKAEQTIVDLSAVIRTMPARQETNKPEKEESLDDKINKLF